ncbi:MULTISPECIES: hypothetical protein [Streptomyces rochei group]|uniref:hypothetical protein n=1 Tax=Streptomyces rochei group TaxID=2867164 RepID=UPI001876E792|nr:hypothetical protein [Streptomyces vinaceusdrappus]GHC13947.1 hypothetical protein GCM10010308_30810 [Streptomyces vinaceusdrappus]
MRAAAQRREATAEFLHTYGDVGGPQEDPAVVVSRLIRQASGHVAWLLERVEETEAEALVWGMTSEVERQGGEFLGVDTTYFEAMNRALEALELTAAQRARVPAMMAGLLRGIAIEGRPHLPAA